jgi:hypothetical protein
MNATSATATQGGGSARAIGIVLIVVIAAVAGLAVGTFIQQTSDDGSVTGAGATYYWPDEPLNQHTPSSFGRVDAANWPDYGLRLRLGAVTGDAADMSLPLHISDPFPNGASSSDTFRLTGPSRGSNANQGENEPVQLRRQPN